MNTLPGLLVSGAASGDDGSVSASIARRAEPVTYVSLPPGTLPASRSVLIRNVTRGSTVPLIFLVEGGFDPVAITAAAGDRLELAFTDGTGAIRIEIATVPGRRPPTIVRTSPTRGRTDVPLNVRPRIVFSEPVDPGTLSGNIELARAGTPVGGEVSLVPGEPWTAEVDPGAALLPGTMYELRVASGIRDLDGDALASSQTSQFTTGTASSSWVAGKIAFVSTRDGSPSIYVVESDGSVRRVAYGEKPAWSPDGTRIAFRTPPVLQGGPSEIRVIDAEGTNERLLVRDADNPAWSPDGARIAFDRAGDIFVVDPAGSGETAVIRTADLLAATGVAHIWGGLAWSPDGASIAFLGVTWDGEPSFQDGAVIHILIANANGSAVRKLEFRPPSPRPNLVPHGRLAWSPDGSRLAFAMIGTGMMEGPEVILSAAVDGTDVRRHGAGSPPVDWSPDGKAVISYQYVPSCICRRIYIVDVGGYVGPSTVPAALNPAEWNYSDYDPAWFRPRE